MKYVLDAWVGVAGVLTILGKPNEPARSYEVSLKRKAVLILPHLQMTTEDMLTTIVDAQSKNGYLRSRP